MKAGEAKQPYGYPMRAPHPKTLHLIYEDYESDRAAREEENDWFREPTLSFAQACERAARSIMRNDRIHDHQRRPGRTVMGQFAEVVVSGAAELRRAKSFEELLEIVEALARTVPGAGALAAYDTADRIGLYMGLPVRDVHLHAGTRNGAKALGLITRRGMKTIAVLELPAPLDKLSPRDAENALCIYAELFLLSPEECAKALAKRKGGCGTNVHKGC